MQASDVSHKSAVIAEVCGALSTVGTDAARTILHRDYKFEPEPVTTRRYGPAESTRIFLAARRRA